MVLPKKKENELDEVMVGGFSGTVALPKNVPLINMESSGGLSTSKESPDPCKKPNQS